MRLSRLAGTFSAACLLASPLAAQTSEPGDLDARAAVEGFLTDRATLGAETATVGEVTLTGERVTARGVVMRWSVDVGTTSQSATVNLDARLPTVEVENLEQTDNGYAADLIAIPEAIFTVEVEGGPEPYSNEFTMSGYRLEAASWNRFPVIVSDPSRPISRFAPLLDWSIDQSYALNEVARIAGEWEDESGRQTFAYGPISIQSVRDGVIETFSYGPFTSEQTVRTDGPPGSQPRTIDVTNRYGESSGRGMDLRPLIALLTGTGAADGPQTVIEEMTLADFSVETDEPFSLQTGTWRLSEFTMDASRGPIMDELDALVVAYMEEREPDPAVLARLMLDYYGAFGIGSFSLEDLRVDGADPADGTFSGGFGELSLEDLSVEGLASFDISDITATTPEANVTLEAFESAGYRFPPRAAIDRAIEASVGGTEPTMPEMLELVVKVETVRFSELAVATPLMGTLSLELYEMQTGDFVGAVPTDIEVTLEGFSLPAAFVQNPVTAQMMRAIGADPLQGEANIELRWDEASERVELDQSATLQSIGSLAMEAAVGGVSRSVLLDPSQAQTLIATGSMERLEARFEDRGLTDFALRTAAEQAGIPVADFIDGTVQQIRLQLATLLGDDALASEVASTLQRYLGDPQNLSVLVEPPSPVPFAQIVGASMTAPQAIPELLNLTISANE